jgi:hypothetical protein
MGTPPSNAYQTFPGTNFFLNPGNVFAGNGSALTGLWRVNGNAGTMPGTHFLGTTDNQPLELKVNGMRGLRLEPKVNDATHSNIVNVVGGSSVNSVGAGVYGATGVAYTITAATCEAP